MPQCIICNERYKLSLFNQAETCENCSDSDLAYEEVDPATEIDIQNMQNPSGRVPARYSEIDIEDDSLGF